MARSSGYSSGSFSAAVSSTSYTRPTAHPSGHSRRSYVAEHAAQPRVPAAPRRRTTRDQQPDLAAGLAAPDAIAPASGHRPDRRAAARRCLLLARRPCSRPCQLRLDQWLPAEDRWRVRRRPAGAPAGRATPAARDHGSPRPMAHAAARAVGRVRYSWPALGKLLRCSHSTARLRLAEILVGLCEHQAGRPCRRRRSPSADAIHDGLSFEIGADAQHDGQLASDVAHQRCVEPADHRSDWRTARSSGASPP